MLLFSPRGLFRQTAIIEMNWNGLLETDNYCWVHAL